MYPNNRQRPYVKKVYPKRKVIHTEVKNGVTIFVEGHSVDPYENVPCESLKLKSRIDTGTFENHEGALHHLEKAQGSDIMEEQIEREQNSYQRLKDEYEKQLAAAKTKAARAKVRAEMLKAHPEIESLLNED